MAYQMRDWFERHNWIFTMQNIWPSHANWDDKANEAIGVFNQIYQVDRRMYCFQESLPASRPPPVAFSPPKAPPISAPFVGIFTFTMPQSLPCGLHYVYLSEKNGIFREKIQIIWAHVLWRTYFYLDLMPE